MSIKPRTVLFLIVALSLFSLCKSSLAQQVPTTAEPGILMRSLEQKQIQRRAPKELMTVAPDKADAQKPSAEKAFKLQNVLLDGSSIYDQQDVNAVASDYIGKEASLADLNALARALTTKYRNDGYIFSRVIVPPQKIADGTVRLTAIEGHITDVEFVGDFTDDNGLIKDFSDKIKKSSGPTNEKEIERYLLLIDDLPGIKARSVMSPSETPAGGKITIYIEQDSFEGSLGMDNRGSRSLGPYRATGVAAVNSLFGIHDRTTLRGIFTTDIEEMLYGEITHEEQLGAEGVRLKARYSRMRERPGSNLAYLDIKGNSDNFDLESLYPLIRSRKFNVNILGGFNSTGSQTYVLDSKTSEDRVRSLRIGSHVDFMDSWGGISQIEPQLTKGVPLFGATKDGTGRTRANGEHAFFRANLAAVRVQELWDKFSMQVSMAGQYAATPLLASEEFTLGGPSFGRAYDSGEIVGDSGLTGAVELRYGEQLDNPYVESYQFFTYYDSGRVWNMHPVVEESKTAALSSVGGGVRFNLGYEISGSLEANVPLTRKVSAEGDKDARFFFNVLKRF